MTLLNMDLPPLLMDLKFTILTIPFLKKGQQGKFPHNFMTDKALRPYKLL
jgi:hypothetical protein